MNMSALKIKGLLLTECDWTDQTHLFLMMLRRFGYLSSELKIFPAQADPDPDNFTGFVAKPS